LEIGILIENLMSRLRMVESLNRISFNSKTLNSAEDTILFFENSDNPLLIFDLENSTVNLDGLKKIITKNPLDMERIIGFYPHVRIDLKEQAFSAGIKTCYPRSKFFKNQAEIVNQIISNLLS
jgi:hypothetical protein